MVVKWLLKAMVSMVLTVLILLYPHKVAAIGVGVVGAMWDIAVTIGRNLHLPGVKGALVLPFVLLGWKQIDLLTPLTSENKEINHDQ